MKAKDLVIGKIYRDAGAFDRLVKYVGVIKDSELYKGQHDFDGLGMLGCVCTDDEVEMFISETRQAPKYDRGLKIALYGMLVILGLMVFLAIVSQNLA